MDLNWDLYWANVAREMQSRYPDRKVVVFKDTRCVQCGNQISQLEDGYVVQFIAGENVVVVLAHKFCAHQLTSKLEKQLGMEFLRSRYVKAE